MIRHPVARAGLGLVVGFVGAFLVIQAVDLLGPGGEASADATVVLGVPDLTGYCARDHDELLPLLVVANPYGWECAGLISNVWTSDVVDFDEVCQWQYDDIARGQLVDSNRPESWRCVTDA